MGYVRLDSLDKIKRKLGIEPNGRVQKFFTDTCAKHMDPYVPFDTGALAETAWVNGTPGRGVDVNAITYDQNYAKIVYRGIRDGKKINYQKDKHPQAGSYWDKKMVSAEMNQVVKEVQDYVNRGGK